MKFTQGYEIKFSDFDILRKDCFPREDIDELTYINNINHDNFIFAELNNTIIGYLLYEKIGQYTRLIHLCVSKDYRSKGMGKILLDQLEKHLLAVGVTEISLYVDITNTSAIKLYRRVGFVLTSISFQFSILQELVYKISSDILIETVTDNDLDYIKRNYDIEGTMVQYKQSSKRYELYQIISSKGSTVGIFSFDRNNFFVSSLHLDHPDLIIPVVHKICELEKQEKNLKIAVEDDGIAKYLDEQDYTVIDFELLYMTKTISC